MTRAAEWAERVKAWRRSGQSSGEFSRGREFTARSLLWWSSYFGRHGFPVDSRVGRRSVTLARIVRRADAPARSVSPAPAVVIELGEARVLVEAGAAQATVSMVVSALRASAAEASGR